MIIKHIHIEKSVYHVLIDVLLLCTWSYTARLLSLYTAGLISLRRGILIHVRDITYNFPVWHVIILSYYVHIFIENNNWLRKCQRENVHVKLAICPKSKTIRNRWYASEGTMMQVFLFSNENDKDISMTCKTKTAITLKLQTLFKGGMYI